MKPNVSYQGFRNAQTWCVSTAFKNDRELHDAALLIVKRERFSHVVCETLLKALATRYEARVHEVAPWAWSDRQTLTDVVWREIRVEIVERYLS